MDIELRRTRARFTVEFTLEFARQLGKMRSEASAGPLLELEEFQGKRSEPGAPPLLELHQRLAHATVPVSEQVPNMAIGVADFSGRGRERSKTPNRDQERQ